MTSAIILAFNVNSRQSNYYSYHGGETLLNRQLVALSKSGFQKVWILTCPGESERMTGLIQEVSKRVRLAYTIIETPGDNLGEIFSSVTKTVDGDILLFRSDLMIHPTLLNPIVMTPSSSTPVFFVYGDVHKENGRITFKPALPQKYHAIFNAPKNFKTLKTDDGYERFDLEIARVHSATLAVLDTVRSIPDLWQTLRNKPHSIQPVSNGWWLKITDSISASAIQQVLWGIAFKEISGEFSKAVNSKISKPLSFWFSRIQVAPNTISSAQLILYALASLFLLWPDSWTFIPFAVIWQFAAGVLDRCDGETARIRNYESEDGAKYDVLIDDLRFLIPFAAVTARAWLLHQELSYLLVFGATMAVFLILTSLEIRFMRRKGYLSRQVMGVDYTKSLESGSAWARFFRRFRPFFKGDARTFMISVLSLSLNTLLIFWLFVANIIYMALQGAVLVWQLRSKNTTPTAHNAELVRS
jgi:phosphatidylglycerophosphate synthase